MPTLRTIASELELALQRNLLSDKSAVPWPKLIEQIKNKRASEIARRFGRSEQISSAWLSTMGVMETTSVRSGEDPDIPALGEVGYVLGKVSIPEVINLQNNEQLGDHGINLVMSPDGRCQHYYVSLAQINTFIMNPGMYLQEPIYTVIGSDIFIYPYRDHVNLKLILFDPLEGYVIDTSFKKSGELIVATDYNAAVSYEVISGQVEHDGITYNAGEFFTAVETTFIGSGKIKLADRKRQVTEDDYYPMDSDLKDSIIKRIIAEDYAMELQLPVDNKIDGKHENTEAGAPNRVRNPE